jgi:hypothetical protein
VQKKDLEATYFALFRRARPDLELGEVEHGDAPDFVLRWRGSTLGIEVTRFSPLRDSTRFVPEEQDSLRGRVLDLARDHYYGQSSVALHVQALFNDHRPLVRKRVAPLAEEIAAYLAANAAGIALYEQVPFTSAAKYPFMGEVGALTAFRVPQPSYGVWYAGKAGWVRNADLPDFEGILAIKEPLLSTYKRKADEVWLLCVFEVTAGGTHVGVPRQVDFSLETGFDRVFALERFSGACSEIPVVNPDVTGRDV